MSSIWEIRIEPSATGVANMEMDAWLLERACQGCQSPVARIYSWNEPTLSLGYFQKEAEIPAELRHLPTVRRLTGGGAILHDREITYSIVMPTGSYRREAKSLVRLVHGILKDLLAGSQFSEEKRPANGEADPFLCFQRRSPDDLVLGDQKVLGSAQRNRRGTILQHGSLILGPTSVAPSILGLAGTLSQHDVWPLIHSFVNELTHVKW